MNKKGFTLVELLTVVILLSLIAIITTPVIIGVLNSSKDNLHQQQVKIIEKAAERWGIAHLSNMPSADGSCHVKINELSDYLSNSENLKDPNTGQNMTGGVIITKNGKKYSYKYESDNTRLGSSCTA